MVKICQSYPMSEICRSPHVKALSTTRARTFARADAVDRTLDSNFFHPERPFALVFEPPPPSLTLTKTSCLKVRARNPPPIGLSRRLTILIVFRTDILYDPRSLRRAHAIAHAFHVTMSAASVFVPSVAFAAKPSAKFRAKVRGRAAPARSTTIRAGIFGKKDADPPHDPDNPGFDTLCLHAGYTPIGDEATYGLGQGASRGVPLYRTAPYQVRPPRLFPPAIRAIVKK